MISHRFNTVGNVPKYLFRPALAGTIILAAAACGSSKSPITNEAITVNNNCKVNLDSVKIKEGETQRIDILGNTYGVASLPKSEAEVQTYNLGTVRLGNNVTKTGISASTTSDPHYRQRFLVGSGTDQTMPDFSIDVEKKTKVLSVFPNEVKVEKTTLDFQAAYSSDGQLNLEISAQCREGLSRN